MLCYGVLMHIPNVRAAVGELARVTARTLIVSEGNMHSLDSVLVAVSRRLRRRPPLPRTVAGIESTITTPTGPLFIRRADVSWLISEFERQGLQLEARSPGQLTELYTRLPACAEVIHAVNRWWAQHGHARLASGNVLVLTR